MNFTKNQKRAINCLENNLQIIACAGSGKTAVVSERVATILKKKEGITPGNIIAFTFTEKAASELKIKINRSIKEHLGELSGLAEMYVGTIHGFCFNLLQDNISKYQKFTILDEVRTKLFIDKYQKKLGRGDIKKIDNDKAKKQGLKANYRWGFSDNTAIYLNLVNILRESELNRENKIPPKYKDILEKYDNLFIEHGYFDYTMIMQKAIEELKENKKLRHNISDTIKYVIVDEYQDVNPIQEKLIKTLYSLGANLCVVGDDDQTIYQWRGSEIENILTFEKRYEDVEKIYLDKNFRSSEAIVTISKNVIEENEQRFAKDISHGSQLEYEIGDVVYEEFENPRKEALFIADRIEELIDAGFKYTNIGILLRTHKLAEPIIDEFSNRQIPFIVEGVNNLFQTHEITSSVAIFKYLKTKEEETKEQLIENWMSLHEDMKKEDVIKAVKKLEENISKKNTPYFKFSLQKIFHDFLENLNFLEESKEDAEKEIILYNLGKFSQVINDFESIHFKSKPKQRVKSFLEFLENSAGKLYPEGHLQNEFIKPDAVRIMTVHKAKGLQFPIVFIPGLTKNSFPLKRRGGKTLWHYLDKKYVKNAERYKPDKEQHLEDERRLFYVALTRAQKYVFLTRAITGRNKKISNFLVQAKHNRRFTVKYDNKTDYSSRNIDVTLLKSDEPPMVLNFSLLNDFYNCPFRFKITYLYGFVQPIVMPLGYGRSMHNIVMEINRLAIDGKTTTADEVPKLIEKHFHVPYAYDDLKKTMGKKATKSLEEYLRINNEDLENIKYAEKNIEIELDNNIIINGRIDLVIKKDLSGNTVTSIVDFKTSERAAKDEVSAEQLKIYALGYKKLTGKDADLIEFYNLDNNEQESRKLHAKDLAETKEMIVQSARSIRSNSFVKNESKCEKCYLNYLCVKKSKE